jgi:hypothetical protein
MRFNMAEGELFIEEDPDFLVENFGPHLPLAYGEYLQLRQAEKKEGFAVDAFLLISFEDLGRRIIALEDFQEGYPEFPAGEEISGLHEMYLWFFLHGMDNSPIFSWDNGTLVPEAKEAFAWFIIENGHRPSGTLVGEFYQLLEAEGFQESERIWDFLMGL